MGHFLIHAVCGLFKDSMRGDIPHKALVNELMPARRRPALIGCQQERVEILPRCLKCRHSSIAFPCDIQHSKSCPCCI